MQIDTNRLVIRDFVSNDLADLHAILGDEETMRYLEPAYTLEKTRAFLETFCIGRRCALAAVHRESGRLIGYLLFAEVEADVYELGWVFHRAYWRQGYASEACRAVIDQAFVVLHASRVFAETIDAQKSVPLMQKLGMQCKSVQRRHTCGNDGTWYDLHLYELTADDRSKSG